MRIVVKGVRKAHRQSDAPVDPRLWGAQCDICPLQGSTPVWGDGPKDAEMAFVDEGPGGEEKATGIPLCGRNGELFEAYLQKVGVKRLEVWVDQAVMCTAPGGDLKAFLQRYRKDAKVAGAVTHSPVECCRPRLMRALRFQKCSTCSKFMGGPDACACEFPIPMKSKAGLPQFRVIVPLGNTAMEAVMGFTGITARRGYVFDLYKRREERAEKGRAAKDPKVKELKVTPKSKDSKP